MKDLAIIVYTHSDVKDIWAPFFGQTERYLPDFEKYIFVDGDDPTIPDNYGKVFYDDSLGYRARLIHCLQNIDKEFVIYNHEDMFLYDYPDIEKLLAYKEKLNDTYCFVRLMKGGKGEGISDTDYPELGKMDNSFEYIFAIQPSIWKREKLIEVLQNTGGSTIWQFEAQAQKVCRDRGILGYYINNNGRKRGRSHWDCKTYPYIATAISKGLWNTREYSEELGEISKEYKITLSDRGTNG